MKPQISPELQHANSLYEMACEASDKYGGKNEDFFAHVVGTGNQLFSIREKLSLQANQTRMLTEEARIRFSIAICMGGFGAMMFILLCTATG